LIQIFCGEEKVWKVIDEDPIRHRGRIRYFVWFRGGVRVRGSVKLYVRGGYKVE
jgi:hypothetical protein